MSGTEDTGYNEDDISAYIKPDNAALLLLETQIHSMEPEDVSYAIEMDDFDVDQYELMLKEHRN